MHHLAVADGITELWYSEKYPESTVVHAWELLVKRHAPAPMLWFPCESMLVHEKCVALTASSVEALDFIGKQHEYYK